MNIKLKSFKIASTIVLSLSIQASIQTQTMANLSVQGCWTRTYTDNIGRIRQTFQVNGDQTWTSQTRVLESPNSSLENKKFNVSGNWYVQQSQLILQESEGPRNIFIQTSNNTLQAVGYNTVLTRC